jgi:hypothetical protein
VSCKKETVDLKLIYNQKANEVLQQAILDDSRGCVLEFINESVIESSLSDMPKYDVRKKVIEELHLENRVELDSIEKLGENFIFDSSFLKQKKIKLIKREFFEKITIKDTTFFHTCPDGVTGFTKPIFDKNFKTAIIYNRFGAGCIGWKFFVYRYRNGKWIPE